MKTISFNTYDNCSKLQEMINKLKEENQKLSIRILKLEEENQQLRIRNLKLERDAEVIRRAKYRKSFLIPSYRSIYLRLVNLLY